MPEDKQQLLLDFNNRFLGYGSLDSDFWLIGPEQGGGENVEEVYRRASVWSEREKRETEDLHDYHAALRFDWTQKIQPTWGGLIKVILSFKGKSIDPGSVMEFQRNELGRADGENCVLDVCPFPSRSNSDWGLAGLGLGSLSTRERYEADCVPDRCILFGEKIAHYKPGLVLFYGSKQRSQWEQISDRPFSKSPQLDALSLARNKDTLFALMPSPPQGLRFLRGTGAVNQFLADVGKVLREAFDKARL